jgi:hypothetical protein
LTCFTFLETIQLDRLHHFLPEVVAVGFSHKEGRGKKTLLVYVLTLMNAAIYPNFAQLLIRSSAKPIQFSSGSSNWINKFSTVDITDSS